MFTLSNDEDKQESTISYRIAMRPIVDRQTPLKTLPSLAVGKNLAFDFDFVQRK